MKILLSGLLSIILGFTAARLIPFAPAASPEPGRRTFSAAPHPPDGRAGALEKPSVNPSPRAADWQAAAKAWMEADPAGFCRWLVKRGIPPGMELMQQLFTTWAKQDPEAAFAAVFNLPTDFQRQQQVMDLMLNAVIEQPGGLRAALRWIPAVDEQVNVIQFPAESGLKATPPEQIAAVLAENASGEKYDGMLIRQFAGFWVTQDRAAALLWAQNLPSRQRVSALAGLIQSWSQTDPAAALDYLSREASSGDRFNSFWPLKELAKTDPQAALNWWEGNQGVASPNCLESIFSPWCEANTREARDYALKIEDPTLRRNCLEAWGSAAEQKEVRAAIEEIQDERNRRILIETLARNSSDPETGTFLRHLLEAGGSDMSPGVVSNVSERYAYKEPGEAFAWAGTLPENLQPAAARAVLGAWRDKVAAAQAVEQLPEGPFKTTAQQALREK